MFCADTCHELFLERVMELLSTATHPNIMTKKCDVACSLFSTICDFEEGSFDYYKSIASCYCIDLERGVVYWNQYVFRQM